MMLFNSKTVAETNTGRGAEAVLATKQLLLNPKTATYQNLDQPSRDLLIKTIAFFEHKGKEKLKSDDHERVWYADFLEFSKKEKLFSTFLTPDQDGAEGGRWDT